MKNIHPLEKAPRTAAARSLLLIAALMLNVKAGSAQEASAGLRIDLNIPTLRIEVSEGERHIATYPVAVGKPMHDTPTGVFRISRAEWNPSWRPPQREWTRGMSYVPPGPENPMGRVKMFFSPLYYIHGTPDEESLASPASHGCVRMLNDDAVELATLLHEEARPSMPATQIESVLAEGRTTRVSHLQDSVTFVVRYDPVVVEEEEIVIYPDIYDRGIPTEAVYQAILAAGYDASRIGFEEVHALLARARRTPEVVRVPLPEAFAEITTAAPPPQRAG